MYDPETGDEFYWKLTKERLAALEQRVTALEEQAQERQDIAAIQNQVSNVFQWETNQEKLRPIGTKILQIFEKTQLTFSEIIDVLRWCNWRLELAKEETIKTLQFSTLFWDDE